MPVARLNITLQFLALLGCLCVVQQVGAHPGMDATLDYLSTRIANNPNSQSLYHQRGVAYLHDRQYRNALSDLQYAATLGDPSTVGFHLGVVHYQMENFDAARACLDAYLKYPPDHIGALRQRAQLRKTTGDHAGALSDYRAVLALQHQANPVDYLAAAELMVELRQHGIDAAIQILDQGMERMGKIPQLQQRAMALELSQGRYDRAISRLQSVARGASENPFWQVEMGQLLLAAGKTDQGYRHLATAQQQLAELRKTPARVKLLYELQALFAERPE